MAQRVVVEMQDDLDGSAADETVSFAYRNTSYEIDLSNANAAALDDALAKYIDAARKVGGAAPKRASRTRRRNTAAIRQWAESRGIPLAARGRIPATVVEQYHNAGNLCLSRLRRDSGARTYESAA
jgi:hypothetical protein